MSKTFFDVHCHLFNLIDVPLWESVSGAMRMHTLVGLASILAGERILKEQRYFLRFFERSSETNLLWLAKQIDDAVQGDQELNEFLDSPTGIVITPLIMDFDTHIETLTCMPGDECVEGQYHRLDHAITECHADLASSQPPVRAFPFMGLALDKLNHNDPTQYLNKLQKWWAVNGMTLEERNKPWDQMPQKAIGIKLYPALGFQPYPSSQDKEKYLEFYHWCVENSIPITAHCQPSAFDPDNLNVADKNSSPAYWQKVLETDGLQTLRINFAHFGGGGNIPEVLNPSGDLNTHNETSIIINLLRKYPHTYADLAAINFRDSGINLGFARLLTQDLHKEHGSQHSLCEKLIWGSDVPMVIGSPQYQPRQSGCGPEMGYVHCLRYFKSSIDKVRSIDAGQPDCLSQTKQRQVMQAIVSTNPERFLHG
jgi:hypothetical protein